MRFGQAKLVGLHDEAEGGVKSYARQIAEGTRGDGLLARLGYLARANYAYNYINWMRKRSNDPAFIARAGRIERRLRNPIGSWRTPSARAAEFLRDDFHFEPNLIPLDLVRAFRRDLESPRVYHDPYSASFRHEGATNGATHPFLYMDPDGLFQNEHFLEICSTPGLIDFCRETLGPSAALSWAWAWVTRPHGQAYQNQNWHRDSSEPLNFIRIFIPLQDIRDVNDGPTEVIPATSNERQCYEVRRFGDHEVADLKARKGGGVFLCRAGDVYFVNTFAIHRGTPPRRQRAMLTLLVSISPSHRTPSIPRRALRDLPERLRPAVAAHRGFFRHLVR